MAPVEFRRGIWGFSTGSAWETGLPSCCEGILGVALGLVQGNQDLSQAEGALSVFSLKQDPWGSTQDSTGETGLLLWCEGKLGFLLS